MISTALPQPVGAVGDNRIGTDRRTPGRKWLWWSASDVGGFPQSPIWKRHGESFWLPVRVETSEQFCDQNDEHRLARVPAVRCVRWPPDPSDRFVARTSSRKLVVRHQCRDHHEDRRPALHRSPIGGAIDPRSCPCRGPGSLPIAREGHPVQG